MLLSFHTDDKPIISLRRPECPILNSEMLIAGEWTDGSSGKSEPSSALPTARQSATYLMPVPPIWMPHCRAALGFNVWRKKTPHERQAVLEHAARLLEDRFDNISANLTREMGKPIGEAKIELRVAIDLLRWYAEEGKRVYGRIIPSRFRTCSMRFASNPLGQWLRL